jgi:Zn-dependent protease with chaperone function
LNRAYSRACEYSCDWIGAQLSPVGASKGLLILASGTELFKKINVNCYLIDSKEDRGFSTWLHDIFSTHPSLSKRVEATAVNKALLQIRN